MLLPFFYGAGTRCSGGCCNAGQVTMKRLAWIYGRSVSIILLYMSSAVMIVLRLAVSEELAWNLCF
jgi:hypothetical protein